jgi:hypothetical protein
MDFTTPDGHHGEYTSFTLFVEAHPPRGLGGRVSQLIALCGTDKKLADLVKRMAREAIPAVNPHGTNQHGGGGTASSDRDERGTADDLTSRLKRDDPELAERVVAGDITPNAAAREKGWRKPRIVLTSPDQVARKIRENWDTEQIADLIRLLMEGDNG